MSASPPSPPPASSVFDVTEHKIAAAHIREYARAVSTTQEDPLLLHVKQYVPKDNPQPQKGDVTIIGGHANGFPKELYEPLWEDFHRELTKRGVRIRAIWIADTAWQGQSGRLNAQKLGNDPGWLDYARDIVHMINTFRMPRPIVGMGHSFGGNALTNVSLLHPRLLTSLVLLDPVMSRFASTPGSLSSGPAGMSIRRRDVWPSRDEAAKSFAKSSFYKGWDPRVLQLWIEHGLEPVPGASDGRVTLSTNKHQEVFTYLRPSWPAYDAEGKDLMDRSKAPDIDPAQDQKWPSWPLYRSEGPNTFANLPHVRPGVLYIFGGNSALSPAEFRREKMDTTGVGVGGSGGEAAGRVKAVTSEEHGHLVPLEAPGMCADVSAEWIKGELERWWAEEREYDEWTRLSQKDKSTLSNEYKAWFVDPREAERKPATKAKAKI